MAPQARPDRNSSESDSDIVDMIPALRAFARTFCRDRDDADDLVQETLTRGLANIHQFQPGTRMKSWLFTIMRNTFYTKAKIARREAPASFEHASRSLAIDPTQEWSVHGTEIEKALQRLPENQRELLVLICMLGASYEEASEICGCTMGTIKSRLNRGRQRLLEELGEAQPRLCSRPQAPGPSDQAPIELEGKLDGWSAIT